MRKLIIFNYFITMKKIEKKIKKERKNQKSELI